MGEPLPAKPGMRRDVKIGIGIVVTVVIAALVGQCSNSDNRERRESAASTSATARPTTTAHRPAPGSTPPRVAQIPCQAAPATVVDIINGSFLDGASRLENAQAVELPDAMTLIGADIYTGDSRASSWDRWLVSDGVVYAMSPDARRRTLLPDGRKLTAGLDDYDYRESLDACVLEQSRQRTGS